MEITDQTIVDGLTSFLDQLGVAQIADIEAKTVDYRKAEEGLTALNSLTDEEAERLLPGYGADKARSFLQKTFSDALERERPVAENLFAQAEQAQAIHDNLRALVTSRRPGEMFLALSANGTVTAASASTGLAAIREEQKAAVNAKVLALQREAEALRIAAEEASMKAMSAAMQIDAMFNVVALIPPALLERVLAADGEAIAQVVGVLFHPDSEQRSFTPSGPVPQSMPAVMPRPTMSTPPTPRML